MNTEPESMVNRASAAYHLRNEARRLREKANGLEALADMCDGLASNEKGKLIELAVHDLYFDAARSR